MLNKQLLHLIAFWSAWFISSHGSVTISSGLRNKLIQLLEALPSSFEGLDELRIQAALLHETETIGVEHPLNQKMLSFMDKHGNMFPDEFQGNLDNIKNFFRRGK